MTAQEYLVQCRQKNLITPRDEEILRWVAWHRWGSTSQLATLFWADQKSAWVAARRRLEKLQRLGVIEEGPGLVWQEGPPEKTWQCPSLISQVFGGTGQGVLSISLEDWMLREWEVLMDRTVQIVGGVCAPDSMVSRADVRVVWRRAQKHSHWHLYWGTRRSSLAGALWDWRQLTEMRCGEGSLCVQERSIVIPAPVWPLRRNDAFVAQQAQRVVSRMEDWEDSARPPFRLFYVHDLKELLRRWQTS